MKSYKELKVWQLNQKCIKNTLLLMRELPNEYAMQHIAKQLFRSVSSIGANLAEGQSSYEGQEFLRYINIALRSAIETDHWFATLQNLLGDSLNIERLMAENVEVIKMLKGLKASISEDRSQ